MANIEACYDFPAGSWDYPTSNPAVLSRDVGANGTLLLHYFDDTTEELVESVIKAPNDLDASGTVTFEAYGYARTAVAAKNIELNVYHSAKTDAENWDAAYASLDSGDLALDGTQDQLDHLTFTETVANLGWAANDHIRIKLSRIAPSEANLSGDWCLTHFRIRMPRS